MKEQIPMYSKEDAINEAFRMKDFVDQGAAKDYSSAEKKVESENAIIGSQNKSLDEIGVKVDKQLSPTFGIIFEKKQ